MSKIIIGLNFLLLLIACNQSSLTGDAKNVYNNRVELIRKFISTDVWRRGDSAFLLHIYNDGKVNGYLFRGNNGIKLQSDTVQFQLSEIERFKNVNTDTLSQNNGVRDLLIELLNKMDTLNIRDVSSDFSHLGINLKIYLKKGGVIFFVKNLSAVTNPEWQKYIKESKKIDENWYYNEE